MSISLLIAAALIVAGAISVQASQTTVRRQAVPVPAYADRMLALSHRATVSPLKDDDAFTGASSARGVARTFGY